MKAALLLLVAMAAPGAAEARSDAASGPPATFVIDSGASEVSFTLGATLHTVEGTVPLERGHVRFHPQGGPASGEVVLDARGIDTGIDRRDRAVHETVLESERYPRIVFTPERLEVLERSARSAQVRLHGRLAIHGSTHDVVLPAQIRADDGRFHAEGTLTVPYVAWGMEDPSNLLLRVEKEVEVRFRAVGALRGFEPAPGP